MSIVCPSCGSTHIIARHMGRKVSALTGGTALGAASALAASGAKTGLAVGLVGGPLTMGAAAISGAVIAGLFGFVTGSLACSKIGDRLDEQILDNFECADCGTTFRLE